MNIPVSLEGITVTPYIIELSFLNVVYALNHHMLTRYVLGKYTLCMQYILTYALKKCDLKFSSV